MFSCSFRNFTDFREKEKEKEKDKERERKRRVCCCALLPLINHFGVNDDKVPHVVKTKEEGLSLLCPLSAILSSMKLQHDDGRRVIGSSPI